MTKEFIQESYRLALSDFELASNEEDKQKALAELARLTAVATDFFGFEFADSLREGVEL